MLTLVAEVQPEEAVGISNKEVVVVKDNAAVEDLDAEVLLA